MAARSDLTLEAWKLVWLLAEGRICRNDRRSSGRSIQAIFGFGANPVSDRKECAQANRVWRERPGVEIWT